MRACLGMNVVCGSRAAAASLVGRGSRPGRLIDCRREGLSPRDRRRNDRERRKRQGRRGADVLLHYGCKCNDYGFNPSFPSRTYVISVLFYCINCFVSIDNSVSAPKLSKVRA